MLQTESPRSAGSSWDSWDGAWVVRSPRGRRGDGISGILGSIVQTLNVVPHGLAVLQDRITAAGQSSESHRYRAA